MGLGGRIRKTVGIRIEHNGMPVILFNMSLLQKK